MSMYNDIADFLKDLSNIHNKDGRRALVLSAGLDGALFNQIDCEAALRLA